MAEPEGGEEEDEVLRARLGRLSDALAAQRKTSRTGREEGGADGARDGFGSAMALGLRAASEFVASIAVGVFIGWLADAWLGTKPALLIAFFFLGVAAGVWSVIRATATPSRRATPDQSQAGTRRTKVEDEDED